MIENSKNKILSDSCMLCNLLLGKINKFEFSPFCKKGLKNGKTPLTFAYDVEKKRIIYQNHHGKTL
jgi:hypothetical protein